MKTPVRRRVAAAAMLLLLPLATACGFSAQTDQVYQPAVGVNDRSGEVYILNATVVSGGNDVGVLAASLVNTNQTESTRLIGVTGPQVNGSTKTVPIKAADLVNLADLGSVVVSGPDVAPGKFVRLTLNFANGQTTPINVPVVDNSGDYSAITVPTAAPSPSATPSS